MFKNYANKESDDVINGYTFKVLNHEYLKKYWSSVLQTWHQKSISQTKQSDTYYVFAMAILLAPVSFCEKANVPICNICKWDILS